MENVNLQSNYWLRKLVPDSQVWWNDPSHGRSSGYYTVREILTEDGIATVNSIVRIGKDSGLVLDVPVPELFPMKPDGLYPVVDGDCGSGDMYGYATTKEAAINVGNEIFVDEVVDAYLAINVKLSDRSRVPHAWVALTGKSPEGMLAKADE